MMSRFVNGLYSLRMCLRGMVVKTGKGADGKIDTVPVPIHYGSRDRVVSSISSGFDQNRMIFIPMMSCYMTGIDLNPDRRHGTGVTNRMTSLPAGGVYPDDLKVVYRQMPIPYDLTYELCIYASSTKQSQEILEQILILFDPLLQIQKTDAAYDWTKLTQVELMGIQPEENYPTGTDQRVIMWTLTFRVPIWLSLPMEVRSNIIDNIITRIAQGDTETIKDFDELVEQIKTKNANASLENCIGCEPDGFTKIEISSN